MRRFFILLILLKSYCTAAQQPDLVFHNVTEKHGLSYNIINCFLKDRYGMLWIGTYNGLNRYDGAHFYIFRKGRDKNTLADNAVHDLAEDTKGNIWGATDNGIFCYYRNENYFKRYTVNGRKSAAAISNILCDVQGNVWANSAYNLLKLNIVTDSFEAMPDRANIVSFSRRSFPLKNGLAESTDGKGLWICTYTGVMYYDKEKQTYTTWQNNIDSTIFRKGHASALCATPYGHYWFFDNAAKKLVGFDPVSKKVKYTIVDDELKKFGTAATIFEDNNHLLWVSTWGYQVYTIDYLHGNIIKKIVHDEFNKSSIAGDFFWAAMQEKDGTVWLGTVGGISKCNTSSSFYKMHNFTDSFFTEANPSILFATENKYDNSWWLATNKQVLLHYDPASLKTMAYPLNQFPPSKLGLQPTAIHKMLFFKDRMLLFSNNGLWQQQGAAGFRPLQIPPIADSIMRDGAFLNDSVIICSDGDNAWRWNINNNAVEELLFVQPFTVNDKPPGKYFLTSVGNENVWMVHGEGWLGKVSGSKLYPYAFDNGIESGNGYYTCVAADRNGNLWITKKGDGLIFYNTAKKEEKVFKEYDGLIMNHVMAVSADHRGKIWSVCYNQFSVYNPLLNSFYNFTLPVSENNYAYTNHMATLNNGNIICNVADRMIEFYPDRIKVLSENAQPLISMVNANGKEGFINGDSHVWLQPHENSINIKFGLLADYEASAYDMLFILDGAEEKWTTSGSNFEATYNSLQPGNYIFRVKALAKDKSWQTKETILQIHLATPFYKSWWFISIVALMAFATCFFVYRLRITQKEKMMVLESKAQLLEKEKTQVMYENLKQHLNPHFLFNSLTSLSSLIRIDQKMAGNFLDKMSKVYRYILKNRDNETVPLADEIKFVQLYIDLQKTRFEEGLIININIEEEFYERKIAPVTLQNLVENAIKHNIADATMPLMINLFVEDDYLVVKNNLQKKNFVETSNKQGLHSMQSLYSFLSNRRMVVEESEQYFIVKVPLI